MGIRPLPSKTQAINNMHPPKTAKQVCIFLGLAGYYRKFIETFTQIAKALTLLTHHKTKFEWSPTHHTSFMMVKEAIIQAPTLHYPDPGKKYIVYMDASGEKCGRQLSQDHNGTKLPVAFFSHTFTETQRKRSTTEQEAYGVYYAITKWNYYLQGSDIIVCNNHKPLAKLLNGKNANNIVNRWGLELASYHITFKWISGARNKAANCLSRLVNLPNNTQATVMMLTVTNSDGPAFNTRSQASQQCQTTKDTGPSNIPSITNPALTTVESTQDITPKPLTANRHEALFQMQRTDTFCENISKRLSNSKGPQH